MKQNVEIVTFATHEEGTLNDLVHNPYNVPVKVLGFGEKWMNFSPFAIFTDAASLGIRKEPLSDMIAIIIPSGRFSRHISNVNSSLIVVVRNSQSSRILPSNDV